MKLHTSNYNRLLWLCARRYQIKPQRNKPVGFYGPITTPVPNAPSSQICGQNPWNDADATFLDPHISVVDCRCTPPVMPLHAAGGCRNGKLQNVSPPSVMFESSRIFFTIHRRHRRKKWWTRILKFEFCDFWEFFEIFKKASRGPSAPDLDHYGRGQTR